MNSTVDFDPKTGLLTGAISTGLTAPIPSLADVVVTAYSDVDSVNLQDWFAQCRTHSDGTWTLSTATLSAGPHLISLTFDYGCIAATTSITTTGPGNTPDGPKVSLVVNHAPRA